MELLKNEPRIAGETTIELHVQDRTLALSPDKVLRLCQEKALSLIGDYQMVAGIASPRQTVLSQPMFP